MKRSIFIRRSRRHELFDPHALIIKMIMRNASLDRVVYYYVLRSSARLQSAFSAELTRENLSPVRAATRGRKEND